MAYADLWSVNRRPQHGSFAASGLSPRQGVSGVVPVHRVCPARADVRQPWSGAAVRSTNNRFAAWFALSNV
jgi:hypothetical protein